MLIPRHRVLSIFILAVGLAAGPGVSHVHGQDVLKAEVRAALDEYVRAFSAHDATAIADGVVAAPSLLLGNEGVVAYATVAEVKKRYATTLDQLTTQKYQRSVVQSATVCVMSDTAAVVSAHFIRYRTDGSTLSEPTATYVFAKSAGHWKIVTQINHAPDRGVTCQP